MGEQRRIQTADSIYLVSNRCMDGQPFMRPTEGIKKIIEDNLAWAADTRGIKLYVYVFRPDSFYMIVSAPLLNLGKFMGAFQGLSARQINGENGRKGKFFAGRYRSKRLLDDAAVLEALGRIFCDWREGAGGRDSSVTYPSTVVSSLSLHRSGEALVGEREDRATYRDIKRARPWLSDDEARRSATTTHIVELAKLPMWRDKAHMNYHRAVCDAVEGHRRDCGAETHIPGISTDELGCRHASQVALYIAPMSVTTDARRSTEFRQHRKELNYQYESASARLRRGRGKPRFPHGMIPPHKSWAVGSRRSGSSPGCTLPDDSSMTWENPGALPQSHSASGGS